MIQQRCIMDSTCSSGGVIMRRSVDGAGAAPADGLASHPREASGRRPPPLRGDAFSGRTRADERGGKSAGCLSGRIRMVPKPKIAAVERREARRPHLGTLTLCRQASPASSAWRDKDTGAPLGAPLPRTFFRGTKLQAHRSLSKNPADDARFYFTSPRGRGEVECEAFG